MKPRPRLVPVLATLMVLGTLAPMALVATDIYRHGQNVPFQDEWDVPMDIALLTADGRLGVRDLFRQHNDGRQFFTYLVAAISTAVAGWSLKLEMFASVVLGGVTLCLVTSLYRKAHPAGRWFVWLPCSLLIFSPLQRRTWLWAIQNQYAFVIAFSVAALWLVRRSPVSGVALLGAAALTLCATFAYANGFLMWFVLIPVLWMLGYRPWPYLAMWGGAAALGLGAYFLTGYRFQVLEHPLTFDPIFLSRFVTVYLGNAFTVREVGVHLPWEIARNAALGSLGVVVFVANLVLLWRRRRSWTDLASWIGLGLFVVGSAMLAGIARNHLAGIEAAMASRYVTLATAFWVAFVAVAVLAMTQLGAVRGGVLYVNGVVLAVLLAQFLAGSVAFARSRVTVTPAQRACFVAYPTSGDDSCFGNLFPSLRKSDPYGAHLLKKLERVAEHGLAAFGEAPRR